MNIQNQSGQLVSSTSIESAHKIKAQINGNPGIYFVELYAQGDRVGEWKVLKK